MTDSEDSDDDVMFADFENDDIECTSISSNLRENIGVSSGEAVHKGEADEGYATASCKPARATQEPKLRFWLPDCKRRQCTWPLLDSRPSDWLRG